MCFIITLEFCISLLSFILGALSLEGPNLLMQRCPHLGPAGEPRRQVWLGANVRGEGSRGGKDDLKSIDVKETGREGRTEGGKSMRGE